MRELLLDKTFMLKKLLIISKFVLVIALLIFFIPLIILPFYNHPFADDYFCGYYLRKGFWSYQIFIYNNWGGRFAATFTGSLFAYHNFLYNQYYVHSLLLPALNFFSIYFLISVVNMHVLNNNFSFKKKLLIAGLLLALEICSLAQASTFIFWFSSAVTYQLPLLLVQIEIALFIKIYNTHKSLIKVLCTMALPSLVFITIGFNELFIIIQSCLFVFVLCGKWYRKNSVAFVLCVLGFIAGTLLLLLSPGNKIRMHEIMPKNILIGIAAIAYHVAETLWNVFRNTLFWFVAITVFIYANNKKGTWRNNLGIEKLLNHRWRFMFLTVLCLIASVTLPVVALKGGIIPERYVNAVICFMLLPLLLIFFTAGISVHPKILLLPSENGKAFLYFLLAVSLLCNNYIVDAYKSIIIAPVYNTILSEREAALKYSLFYNKTTTVKTYDAALSDLIKARYSSSSVTFQEIIRQKPALLFFEDDLATPSSRLILKNYYGLDSIAVQKQ